MGGDSGARAAAGCARGARVPLFFFSRQLCSEFEAVRLLLGSGELFRSESAYSSTSLRAALEKVIVSANVCFSSQHAGLSAGRSYFIARKMYRYNVMVTL